MVARFNIGLPDTQNHPLIQGIIDGVSNTRKCYPRYGRVRKMLSLKVLSSHTPVRPKLFFTITFFQFRDKVSDTLTDKDKCAQSVSRGLQKSGNRFE